MATPPKIGARSLSIAATARERAINERPAWTFAMRAFVLPFVGLISGGEDVLLVDAVTAAERFFVDITSQMPSALRRSSPVSFRVRRR